ncbi:MAG: response regulator [Pyrinomonadaceae bacterium]|nr:response regulator [Pyrinomonadaceae bacterium]
MKRRIIAAVDDMFFAAKIRETAKALGVDVQFARTVDAAVEKSRAEPTVLIIADLQAQACDPFALAAKLKSDEDLKQIPLLGFFSHVQTELQQRAHEAGYDRIVPRSYFSKNLPEILEND